MKLTTESLTVRINREPDILNPVLSNSAVASAIQNLLFLPLMDFDPYTQEIKPVLTSGPTTILHQGNNTGYKIKLREEARWDDGSPVTVDDVVFSLKAILNPFVPTNGKRGVIYPIDSIETFSNPTELIFWTDDNYFLDEQSFTNNFILQESRFDSSFQLKKLSWSALKALNTEDTASLVSRIAQAFALQFTNPALGREGLSGCGPYRIEQWVSNQYLKLKRKEPWWGLSVTDSIVNFSAYPAEITYRIIAEEANAINALKEGLLDLVATDINPANFKAMREDSTLIRKVNFITGPPIRFVYLSLNNRSPLLLQAETRRALAQLMDLDQLQKNLFQGFAQRITAPFQPAKIYYDHDLPLIPFDIEKAKANLSLAGWMDTNHNGTLDKKINNRITELQLRLMVTPGGLGQQIAIHLQEQSLKAGIRIEIIPKPIHLLLESVRNHDFEIAALSDSQYPGPDDPYSYWHTESYTSDGQNFTGFGSPQTDSIIDQIRHSEPGERRTSLYKSLQKEIYDQQAAVFLFAPQNLIALSKKWNGRAASVRPGYFVNDFKPVGQ
ncbi:MAG: ABC transporter substrate-binding protein [Saprospiraceae bacterium]|nr:ABC transporter substrate-binding protein [Saprospiraceae bacterium]